MEAIRHLEGDRLAFGEGKVGHRHSIAHSEESEKESSVTCSETEDNRSELSDRDSPLQYVQVVDETNKQSTLTELHPYVHQQHSPNFHDKYPIASNLLQHVQYYCRPNVIVQKS